MKVLIIEDERQLSEVPVELLKQEEYAVDAVYDGVTGEESVLSGIYDAVIPDIMLPKKDGLEVLSSLRKARISKEACGNRLEYAG